MTALPNIAEFTGSAITEGEFKTALANLHAYLSGLLGTDGSPATAQAALGVVTPPGMVAHFATIAPPAGWLKCDGATLSRIEYPALFAAVGEVFGAGDGSTTFRVPDLRGEFVRGWDDGRGADPSRAFGSAQTDAFKSHNHEYWRAGGAVGDFVFASGANLKNAFAGSSSVGSTETRPRNVALLACIKF